MTERSPEIVQSLTEVRRCVLTAREQGDRIGLIPTMGALHEGHLSLIREAQKTCDFIVVTIFVNPTQFGPHEDFDKYPRPIEKDLQALHTLNVDLVFMPDRDAFYPQDFSTYVLPPDVATRFEGESRDDHFRGVTTVVLKLFNLVPADTAFFGQKDYQQCQVIRRMVEDLNVPIEIQVCPTIREPDGLAMSSRNQYLSPDERKQAVALSSALKDADRRVQAGETDCSSITRHMLTILHDAGIQEIDYAEIADAKTLEPLDEIDRSAVALLAARVSSTHLIDNMLLPCEEG